MILPRVRASVGREDALHLADLIASGDSDLLRNIRDRLTEEGVDGLLDDPRALNALLTDPHVKIRPEIVFYVLVRQSLLEGGVEDAEIADYATSMVLDFARSGRAYRVSEKSEEEYRYLVDIVAGLGERGPDETFILQTHLGEFSLWLSGVFPDFIESRVRRRGAPSMEYYEQMGVTGYSLAAERPEAESLGVAAVFTQVSQHFKRVRVALNRLSDRYMFRQGGDPVGRLLREVSASAL